MTKENNDFKSTNQKFNNIFRRKKNRFCKSKKSLKSKRKKRKSKNNKNNKSNPALLNSCTWTTLKNKKISSKKLINSSKAIKNFGNRIKFLKNYSNTKSNFITSSTFCLNIKKAKYQPHLLTKLGLTLFITLPSSSWSFLSWFKRLSLSKSLTLSLKKNKNGLIDKIKKKTLRKFSWHLALQRPKALASISKISNKLCYLSRLKQKKYSIRSKKKGANECKNFFNLWNKKKLKVTTTILMFKTCQNRNKKAKKTKKMKMKKPLVSSKSIFLTLKTSTKKHWDRFLYFWSCPKINWELKKGTEV